MTRLAIGYDRGNAVDAPTFVAFRGRRMIGAWRALPWWLTLAVRLRLAVLVGER